MRRKPSKSRSRSESPDVNGLSSTRINGSSSDMNGTSSINSNRTSSLMTMRSLMEEVLILDKIGERGENVINRVREIVVESGNIIETSDEPHELVIDAKILATSSHLVRSHVQTLDTNLTTFSPEEYASGITAYLEKSCGSVDWDVLANETSPMFKKMPSMSYMLGTFKLDPPPPPPERRERQKKAAEAKKKCVQTVAQPSGDTADTGEVYAHIMKCLDVQSRLQNNEPVNFLEFIADPDSYWDTNVNIFHCAFLIRDGMMKMTLNEQGIPVVQNVTQSDEQSEQINSQFVLRLAYEEWEQIVKTFKVQNPMITPREAS